MPEIDDVVSGESVEAVWGNQMRDRSLQRYVDATERDVLNPTPEEGDLGYLQNVEEITFFDGVGWRTIVTQTDAGFPWLSKAGDTMLGALGFDTDAAGVGGSIISATGNNLFLRDALGINRFQIGTTGTVLFNPDDETVMQIDADATYRVGNVVASGQDIPGVDIARMQYTQASFNASITTWYTRSASILASESIPHFRLASADSDTDPDRRIAVKDEFFGTSGGDNVHATLAGTGVNAWWNFHRIVSTIDIKEDIFPWNPALPMPATIPGPKQAGGAGATPFTPADLMDLTPVTYRLTPDHIVARDDVDPGEMLGYIKEDVLAKAPWVLGEGDQAIATDAFRMGILELLRDLRDRVEVLEP